MEIKVGEYVRSKSGSIGKITKIEDNKFLYENKTLITWIGKVTKHSFNIIDLIEVGDIVFIEDFFNYSFIHIFDERMLEALKEDIKKDVKLKSILTHEQFEANAYKTEQN